MLEKKIKFISNIYKNVAFDKNINPDNANQILNYTQQLSYRQLTILSLMGQNAGNKLNLRETDLRALDTSSAELEFLLQDFVTLEQQGLIARMDNTTVLDSSDIIPGDMKLTGIGNSYYNILNLDEMSLTEMKYLTELQN